MAKGDALNEAQNKLPVETEGVDRVLHGLIGTTETEEVGGNNPCTAFSITGIILRQR